MGGGGEGPQQPWTRLTNKKQTGRWCSVSTLHRPVGQKKKDKIN